MTMQSNEPYLEYWTASYDIKNRTLVIMPEDREISIFPNDFRMITPELIEFIQQAIQYNTRTHEIDSLIMPHDIYYPIPTQQNGIDYSRLRDVIQNLKTVKMPGKSQCDFDLFSGSVNLEKVVIEHGLSSGRFENCAALSSVQMPNVRCVDYRAFQGCKSLECIQLPSAHQICTYAFLDCSKLKVVEAPWVTHLEGATFRGCQALAVVDMPNVIDIAEDAFPENGAGQLNPIKLLIVSEALSNKDHDYWLSRRIDSAVTCITTKQVIDDWGESQKSRGIALNDNCSLIALYCLHHQAQYKPSWSQLGPIYPDMPFWQLLMHLPKDKRDHTLPKLGNAVQTDIDSMTEDELWDAYMVQSGMPLEQIGVCGYKETLTLRDVATLLKSQVKSAVGSESLIVQENRLVAVLQSVRQGLPGVISTAGDAVLQALAELKNAALWVIGPTHSGPRL
tara:strand:+ start:996 stop:2342 length:1347 start_codon:yes stop_codon:yes gene_type:complete